MTKPPPPVLCSSQDGNSDSPMEVKDRSLAAGAGQGSHEYRRKDVGFTCGVSPFDEMLQQVAWLLKRKKRKLNRIADTSKAA